MYEDGQECVGVKGSSKVDWLSILPKSLLHDVLLKLPTKYVVKSSVLSKTWRNLWRYVPGLDLDSYDFPDYTTFFRFVNAWLGLDSDQSESESYMESFKLEYHSWYDSDHATDVGVLSRWINTIVDKRVKHIVIVNMPLTLYTWTIEIPLTLYTCKSLVSLKLCSVELATPTVVSLPCLKVMDLDQVLVVNNLDYEMLISGRRRIR